MAFDFKKEYREYYLPSQTPVIVDIPPMNYVAVRGKGDHRIDGYFDFVVPPLEGLSIAIDDKRKHHEIYLSDPRKTALGKLRTVIRYPVK